MIKKKAETQEDKAIRRRNREIADLVKILKMPEGRRVVWRMMSQGKVFIDGYIPGDQGYGTTYNEGKKSVSLWLLKEVMESRPEAFTQMQREHKSEAQSEENLEEIENENKDILKTDN